MTGLAVREDAGDEDLDAVDRAAEVGAHDPIPFVEIDLEDRLPEHQHAGVVAHDVDLPELAFDRVGGGAQRGTIRHIDCQRERARAEPAHLFGGCRERLAAHVEQRDRHPRLRERP